MALDIKNYLLPKNMRRTQHTISEWTQIVPAIFEPKDILHPDFWAHEAYKVAVHDRIEVISEIGAFDADLRVVAVDSRHLWVQVRVLRGWPEDVWETAAAADVPEMMTETKDYKYEYAGPHKFRIINATGDVVERDIPTKEAAIAKIAELRAEKLRAA